MTGDQVAAIVMEMHTASFAIAEHVAVCALSFSCPFPIAIFFEAVVPDINKAVFVDISLMEVGTDARTAGYRYVDQYLSLIHISNHRDREYRRYADCVF